MEKVLDKSHKRVTINNYNSNSNSKLNMITDLKSPKNNENIINYGRFVSSSRSKSRLSKSLQENSLYTDDLRANKLQTAKNLMEDLLLNRNSNFMDKTNSNSDPYISKLEFQNKIFSSSLNLHKFNPEIDTQKSHMSKRKRYKSINNEELRKLVNSSSDQTPMQIRSTVNKWLKDTLPMIIIDKDICKTPCSFHSNSQSRPSQYKNPRNCNENRPNENNLEFSKLELRCRELMENLENSKDISTYNGMNFYQLLNNINDCLKLIKTKAIKPEQILDCKKKLAKHINQMEKHVAGYAGNQSNSDLSSLDIITQSSHRSMNKSASNILVEDHVKSMPSKGHTKNLLVTKGSQNPKEPLKNSRKCVNQKLVNNMIEKEINSNQLVRVNTEKVLIGRILSMPKVEIKSKCVVGIYKNFIEEQYVISGFREISKEERIEFLNNEMKKHNCFKKLTHLTTNCSAMDDNSSRVIIDQSVQTVGREFSDSLKNPKQGFLQDFSSQTFIDCSIFSNFPKVPINKLTERKQTISWKSDNLSNNELFNHSENETISSILFENNPNHIGKANVAKKKSNITNFTKEDQLNPVNNKDIVQLTTTEYCDFPTFQIEYDIMEMSPWTANSSNIKVQYNRAIENTKDLNIETSNLIKSSPKYSDMQQDIFRLLKLSDISVTNQSISKTPKNSILPPSGPSNKFLKFVNSVTIKDKEMLSTKEQSCQEIKDSLTKDIPMPENLNHLYERLSKLQKMLEGIPEEKISSTFEAIDQLNSSGSSSPNHANKLEHSQYCEKDQNPISFGDWTEKQMSSDFSKNENTWKSDYQNIPNPLISDLYSVKNNLSSYDEEPSEVTNSLSMLENLIDDFLLKNGLSNI